MEVAVDSHALCWYLSKNSKLSTKARDSLDKSSKIIVSTIPDFETNAYLLSKIRKLTEKVIVILISYNLDDAIKLYGDGATYVIMPHFISGEFAAELANKAGFDINKLKDKRHEHIQYLKERKALGHAHPHWVHHA